MRLYKHKWRDHYTIYLNTSDGFCKLNINPDGTAELYDLVVYPESRRRRHGSLLLSLAIQAARTEGAEVLLLWPACEQWTVEWYERRVRKRARKNAAEVVAEAAAAVAAKVAHEYVEAQPKVDAPAGGIVFPKTLEKTVPKVVVKRELKITKSVTVEAYLTEIGRDEDGRKGHFHFACFASELDKLTMVWNKSPLTVTLSFDEIVEK